MLLNISGALNGANGMSDIEGKVARVSGKGMEAPGTGSDIDRQTDRSNGAFGKSDIEGKTAREAASEQGSERVSNGREHMSQLGNDRVSNAGSKFRFSCFP
jgi:hypothetical protein